jgi:AcrR family transcriptional regulator
MNNSKGTPDSQKPMGRRERRSIETREKIFRVALDLFAERGFNATTIDAIAEGADIGKGTFFNYFENKESILLEFQKMQMG